jgi:hypothetical protein
LWQGNAFKREASISSRWRNGGDSYSIREEEGADLTPLHEMPDRWRKRNDEKSGDRSQKTGDVRKENL